MDQAHPGKPDGDAAAKAIARSADRIRTVVASRAAGIVLHGLILTLTLVLLAQTYRRAYRSYGYDFGSYLSSAEALSEGKDPYHTTSAFRYIYPLALALVLIPLAKLPYAITVGLWFVLSAACLYVAALLTVGWARGNREALTGLVLLIFIGFLDPIQINLLNGQVNSEVLLLCSMFLERYLRGRKNAAAILLGVAVAIKIVPLVFFLFLLIRREWRMVALATLAAAALCLAPVLLVGRDLFGYYAAYARDFLLTRAQPDSETLGEIYFTPYGLASALAPELARSALVRYGLVAAMVTLLAVADVMARRRGAEVLAFCAYLTMIPYLSPLSEVHHLLLAIPAAFFVTLNGVSRPDRQALAAMATFWVCLWLGRPFRHGPFYFLALTALLLGLLLSLRASSPPAARAA